jgi:hypothetical protein
MDEVGRSSAFLSRKKACTQHTKWAAIHISTKAPASSPSTTITFHHHLTPTLTTTDTFEMEITIKNDASLPDSFDRKRGPVALEPALDSGSTTDEAESNRSFTDAYVWLTTHRHHHPKSVEGSNLTAYVSWQAPPRRRQSVSPSLERQPPHSRSLGIS